MNNYLYMASCKLPIIVSAKHKPSEKNIPTTGAWLVREWDGHGKFIMPVIPEIVWNTLKKLKFISEIKGGFES